MKREGWIWAVVGAGLIGLLIGQFTLVLVAIVIIFAGTGAYFWGRHALDRVTYQRVMATSRAFQGDTVQLNITVTNRKLLPLPFVEIQDNLPEDFASEHFPLAPSGIPKTSRLALTTSLGWYERVEWHYPIECHRRGVYRLGPVTLRSGDLFGLFPTERTDKQGSGLLVYPRLRTLAELGLEETMPFGGSAGGDPLFTDPMRIKGTRDYAPGDPHYLVDWKASARAQRLQSRLLEPAATPQVLVFLDVDTFERTWEGTDPEVLEDAVSVAASLAYASAERRFAVGLFSNGTLAEVEAPVRLRPSRHPDQVLHMLELLAKVTPLSATSITNLLEEQASAIPSRTFVFVVTGVRRKELAEAGQRLRLAGIPASLIYLGREPLDDQTLRGLWHDVTVPEREVVSA